MILFINSSAASTEIMAVDILFPSMPVFRHTVLLHKNVGSPTFVNSL